MILSQALHSVNRTLSAANIDDANIEAELLLCSILEISNAQLYSEPERLLSATEIKHLHNFVKRRLSHEPTAYILKRCQFYGSDFYVDRRVMVPRPETELLVEKTVEFAQRRCLLKNQFVIADIGTGSGVIAINLALALPEARIYATDISPSALQVADINRCHYREASNRVKLLQGNLLEPLSEPVNVIVANLPYIKNCELQTLSPEIINFEPMTALASGEDGLDKIRCLLSQAPGKMCSEGCLLLEVGHDQGETVSSIADSQFAQAIIELIPDLSGINRVVKITL
ncbi:MAG: peptide chain release factor N(5)-glutamine methyltransferase [Dehalococcoidia bacterium]|nr:peptide chain release factor N(5)-glutamine methyltransferase [Dehalococcoidia bacterium]